MRQMRTRSHVVTLVLVLLLCLSTRQITRAATFEVNELDDAGDGVCDDTCTLRDAITAANADPDFDTITFSLDAGGPQTIMLTQGTLEITQPVSLDATTQPGYPGVPIITLDGTAVSSDGLTINASGSIVRGFIIGNFTGAGMVINGNGSTIENNYIGWDGSVAIPNASGIEIQGSGNTVQNNTIAGNTGVGIYVAGAAAVDNALFGNNIFDNGGLGIDLAPTGVAVNDDGDTDTGTNDYQNYPVITIATPTLVQGTLNSIPNTSFRLEFFTNAACDPSGYGEGGSYLENLVITTDGAGNAAFSTTLLINAGDFLTATATSPTGSTSEFSACVEITDAPIYSSIPAPAPDSASVIDLPPTSENTPVSTLIAVSNLGSAVLNITNVTLDNTTDFSLVTPATFNVPAGSTVNIEVQCDADTGGGSFVTTVTVTHNDLPRSPAVYTVNCEVGALPQPQFESGPPPPNVEWTAAFGGASTTNLSVTNIGDPGSTLNVNLAADALNDPNVPAVFSIVNGLPLNFSLDQNNSQMIQIRCQPSAAATFTATLTLTTNDPDAAEQLIVYNLTCEANTPVARNYDATPASGALTPLAASQNDPDPTTSISVSNTGGTDTLTITNVALSGDPAISLTTPTTFTVAPDATASISLVCDTAAAGSFSTTITVTHDGTNVASPVTYTLDCTITAAPVTRIYDATPASGALTPLAANQNDPDPTTSISVSNTGGTDTLTITNVALSGDPAISLTTPTTFTVAPDATASISLVCDTAAAGSFSTTITVTHDGTNVASPVTYTLGCTITAAPEPIYQSVPAPGGAPINLVTTQGIPVSTTIAVSNPGNAPLILSSITLSNTTDFELVPPLPATIAGGGADIQNIEVRCRATTASGTPYTTNVTVVHNAAGGTASYTVNCTVNVPPTQAGYASNPVPGSTIDFGSTQVGTPVSNSSLTISETGSAALVVSSPTISGTNAGDFSIIAPAFPLTINDGAASQAVTLQCNPSAAGIRTASLTFSTNDPANPNPSYSLQCTGTAIPAPGYQSAPAPGATIDLGSSVVGTPITVAALTISEIGTQPLTVSNPTISGTHAADFAVTAPAFPLTIDDGGAPQAVSIRCTPGALGTRTATLTFTTNDPTQTSVSYTLQCTGTATPVVNISPATLPNGMVGVAYNQVLTASGGTSPYQFALASGTLPPGLTLANPSPLASTATLAGTPTTAGQYTFTIRATDANSISATRQYTVTIGGYTSFPTPGGFITVNTVPNVPVNAFLTVSNTGTSTLRITSIAVSNPINFSLLTVAPFDIAPSTSQSIGVQCLSPTVGTFLTTLTVAYTPPGGTSAGYTITCNVTTTLLPTVTPFGTPFSTLTPTAIPPTPTPSAPSTGAVNNEVKGQALRTGPYLGATLIGSVLTNQQYPILARSFDEGGEFAWYLIQVGRITGWTSGRYFRFEGNPDLLPSSGSIFDQIDGAPDTGMTAVLPAITDMRRRPSGRAAIIRTLPAGATVSVIGRTRQNGGNYWLHVRYEGQIGWIPAYIENARGSWENVPIR